MSIMFVNDFKYWVRDATQLHSHQTLRKAVRGKNLDVYEGYLGKGVKIVIGYFL